jgi:hypothetical protein
MRFEIDAACKRGLRIIRELPDFEVSRIEGYNGIGKSSALRLLELCTGSQPFQGQDKPWESFRNQLAHANVHVTGLQGGAKEIRWELDPSAWPPKPELLGERLGRVWIDGRSARLEETGSLLRVHTILGNETFPVTLAVRLEASARRLAEFRHGSGSAWRRMETLDTLLREAQEAIQVPGAGEVRTLRLEHANAEARSREAARHVERVQERVARLAEAKELAEQLDDVRGRGPELNEQLAEIQRQQEALRQEHTSLDEQITETVRREHRDEAARREFELARQNLDRRERALRDSKDMLNAAAAEAGSGPAGIAAAQQELSSKLEELTQRLPKVNASPFMAQLLGDITERLRQAEAIGLAEEVLISGSSASSEWTVSAWRRACEREASIRAANGATDTAQDIETEIAQVRKRLAMLARAEELHAQVEQAVMSRDRASQRLGRAIEALPPEEATTLDQLVSAREEAEAQLAELAERHAAVKHALSLLGGGTDEGTLRRRLAQICDETGVPESRIRGMLATEEAQLTDARGALADSRVAVEAARSKAGTAASAIVTAVSAVTQRPDLAFAHRAAAELLSAAGDSDADQAEALSVLSSAIESTRQKLQAAVGGTQSIIAALEMIARQFRGTPRPSEGKAWAKPVEAWLADQVSAWFSHKEVSEALFPRGHDIEVDIEGMAVSWTADGEPMTRPMAAFSSGEQALAYTRARMATLDSAATESANRLIALDEFGAFIAADSMRRLSTYLLDRSGQFPHDQVVVVLPLREEIRVKPDSADTEAVSRWSQLQDRGYLTERIT